MIFGYTWALPMVGWYSEIAQLFRRSEFGIEGLLLAVALTGLAWLMLPAREKRNVTMPIVMLLLHGVLLLLTAWLPKSAWITRASSITSDLVLLLAMGRSAFLLFIDAPFTRRRFSKSMPKIFRDLLQGVVYAMVVMITLRSAGVAPGSLLTTSALLTAMIGLSLQDTLGNLFAGLAIQAQRPFDVGDWVQFDQDPKHVGRVLEINWRATRLLSLDSVEVTVPNGVLAKAPINNFTKPTPVSRRTVSVMTFFDVPPKRVEEVILRALHEVPGVLDDPAPSVVLAEFAERGIEYRIRYYTTEFRAREQLDGRVRERIWYAFNRADIRIPIFVRTIQMQENSDEIKERTRHVEADQRQQALGYVDFIGALPDRARRRLAELSQTRLYASGEVILRQGDAGDELFIIWHGEVAVMFNDVEVARLGKGKFFGEMSVMTGEHRTATVMAVEPCEVIVVDKVAFKEILEEAPDLVHKISEVLVARQAELDVRSAQQLPDGEAARRAESNMILSKIKSFFSLS